MISTLRNRTAKLSIEQIPRNNDYYPATYHEAKCFRDPTINARCCTRSEGLQARRSYQAVSSSQCSPPHNNFILHFILPFLTSCPHRKATLHDTVAHILTRCGPTSSDLAPRGPLSLSELDRQPYKLRDLKIGHSGRQSAKSLENLCSIGHSRICHFRLSIGSPFWHPYFHTSLGFVTSNFDSQTLLRSTSEVCDFQFIYLQFDT